MKKKKTDYVEELTSSVQIVTDAREDVWKLAKEVYLKVLKVSKQKEVPDFVWRDIGMELYFLQDYDKSADSLEHALTQAEKLSAEDEQVVAAIIGDLAMVYEEMRRYSEAYELRQRMVKIRQKFLGDKDVLTQMAKDSMDRVKDLIRQD